MPSNDLWRFPQLELRLDGSALAGAIQVEVSSRSGFSGSRFFAQLALGDPPLSSASFWADRGFGLLSIRAGTSAPGQELIQGFVDDIRIDHAQRTVSLEGRDLTSLLVESKIAQAFPNATASEIVLFSAARHALIPAVAPTFRPVGRVYQDQNTALVLDSASGSLSEWDFLASLARQEGFDLFVSGRTLNFRPAVAGPVKRTLRPGDLTQLRMERTLATSRNVVVTVKSWDSMNGQVVEQSAISVRPDTLSSNASMQLGPLVFTFVQPNLTPLQAQQLAYRRLAEVTQFDRIVTLTMPGETELLPRDRIQLAGTNTSFDQDYLVETITRTIGRSGFTQRIRARNLPLDAQIESAIGLL